jgi:hypothetical protein
MYLKTPYHVGEFVMTKFLSPMRHNRGKTQWTIKSFILQSSHMMILNSTKFGGNRTKDVEDGSDRRTDGETDRPTDSYIYPYKFYINSFYNEIKS